MTSSRHSPPVEAWKRLRVLLARRRVRIALRISGLLLLLGLLLTVLDSEAAFQALRNVEFGPVLLALIIVQIQICLSALRWRITAERLGAALPLRRAVAEYYLANLVNLVLPGGMAGDALRVYRTSTANGHATHWPVALRAVVYERGAGQAAFVVVAVAGLMAWPHVIVTALPSGVVSFIALPVALLILVAVGGWATATFGPVRLRKALTRFAPELHAAFVARGIWFVQGTLSLGIVASYILVFALAGEALGVDLPVLAWLTIVPLILLAMLIPLSIGGWGLREGAAAVLFPLLGLNPALGLATAFLYGLINLAGSAPGLPILLLSGSSARRAPLPQPENVPRE